MSDFTLETVTGTDTLDEIQHTLDSAWSAEEVPDYTRMCMDLAVSEIVSNIIEHSGDGKPVRLRMVVSLQSDTIHVVFDDDGHASDVDLSQILMPDDAAERGRGLAIAHRVLDELSYSRNAQGNRWTLMRRRSG